MWPRTHSVYKRMNCMQMQRQREENEKKNIKWVVNGTIKRSDFGFILGIQIKCNLRRTHFCCFRIKKRKLIFFSWKTSWTVWMHWMVFFLYSALCDALAMNKLEISGRRVWYAGFDSLETYRQFDPDQTSNFNPWKIDGRKNASHLVFHSFTPNGTANINRPVLIHIWHSD